MLIEVSLQWLDCGDNDYKRCMNWDGFWLLAVVEVDKDRVYADLLSSAGSGDFFSTLI